MYCYHRLALSTVASPSDQRPCVVDGRLGSSLLSIAHGGGAGARWDIVFRQPCAYAFPPSSTTRRAIIQPTSGAAVRTGLARHAEHFPVDHARREPAVSSRLVSAVVPYLPAGRRRRPSAALLGLPGHIRYGACGGDATAAGGRGVLGKAAAGVAVLRCHMHAATDGRCSVGSPRFLRSGVEEAGEWAAVFTVVSAALEE
ncbi:hypothetical protein BC567DRAFT_251216 [Phyllosticta citribraziliensis]